MSPKNTPDATQDPATDTAAAPGVTASTKPPAKVKAAEAVKQAKPAKAVKGAKPAAAAKRALTKMAPTAPAVAPAAAPAQAEKATKAKTQPKEKLVRDSFTMPQADFALIGKLKERALGFQRPTKKSELLRAGLQALAALNDEVLQALLTQLPQIKTGRPRKAE